ncbi:hypothetical protein AURDEDRAFT_172828 [Auricularia subglabra TFB-10046 SS5]|uniref:Uncharacterized protein n=1 Tax=Auricularia subglabra (strain TFB-10046 / SS5) TaxID=717982 RepID=J0LIC8_AURST|nr:hypothetical protein AURDEDRAFT_172828 [Auricularia subglabra TFB-10046 SS5]
MAAFLPSFSPVFARDDLQVDYTVAPDQRLAWAIHVQMLEFFPPETAIRGGLQDPADRFAVAYPAHAQGFHVPHGTFKVMDDTRNCIYVAERSDFTRTGIDIAPIIHRHLGLTQTQLDERVQLCTKSTPWFESGVPICYALSYIRGCWVPADNYIHAWELGYPRYQWFLIQTDAVDLWVRDLATNLVYQTSAAELAPGIRVRDLIRKPELLHKPGALYQRHDASRSWDCDDDWTKHRAPCHITELQLTVHRYWLWKQEFNAARAQDPETVAAVGTGNVDRGILNLNIDDVDEDMDSADETESVQLEPTRSNTSSAPPQRQACPTPDSMPDLESVSSSGSECSGPGSGDEDDIPTDLESQEGDVESVTWEEYVDGEHGPGWYRYHACFAVGQGIESDGLFDYESGDARSA